MDKRKQIKKLRDQGKTYQEIGEIFNVSKQRIYQLLPHYGYHQISPLTPKQKQCAFSMYRNYLKRKNQKVVNQK